MSKDYCPYCQRVTPHIKDDDEMMCRRCTKKEKRKGINITKFSTGGFS
jgi:predicted amidophosphoribosyltransferase